MKEIWKEIEGYNGFYQVSNLGNVKSVGGQIGSAIRKPRVLKQSLTADGYPKVRLQRDGKDKTVTVHRLVAMHFVPNPNNEETVNHIDGNKTNNVYSNLEWTNRSGQMIHAYKLNLKTSRVGSSNSNAKLTPDEVRYIRAKYKKNDREFGSSALGRKFGVTHRVITLIANGETYKDVQ